MRYHELVQRVQEKGGFDSRDGAVKAIRATLSTLGECLYRTERRHLASQLPKEAEDFLYEEVDTEVTRQGAACLTLQAFYDRVGARAGVRRTHAIEQAKAVTAVLEEAIPEGEWRHVIRELPKSYEALLTEAFTGPSTPSA